MRECESSQHTVFLSYGRSDASDLALRICNDLESAGHQVWLDTEQIRSGDDWQHVIVDGLTKSDVLVALMSPHSVRMAGESSAQTRHDSVCLDEISLARFGPSPTPIIPVMAAPCEPPLCVHRLDYVDMTGWTDGDESYRLGIGRLLDSIELAVMGRTKYRKWDSWLRPLDFDSYLHERRQGFVGRKQLFREVHELTQNPNERALLITGDPGVGKTAFVAEMARSNPHGQVLACYCCRSNVGETLRPSRFQQTIAAMLASRLKGFDVLLEQARLRNALEQLSATDPVAAFETGILSALRALSPPSEIKYLLVDALDESLIEGRSTIASLLHWEILEGLPSWLRLVATSRREPEVLSELSGLRALNIDAIGSDGLRDVETYIRQFINNTELHDTIAKSNFSQDDVVHRLAKRANGNMLYARLALLAIQRGRQTLDQIDDLPSALRDFYKRSIESLFPTSETWTAARSVLEVLVAADQPIAPEVLAEISGVDPEYELPDITNRLEPVLTIRDGRISLFHQSMYDWFAETTNPYRASVKNGRRRIATAALSVLDAARDGIPSFWRPNLEVVLAESGEWDRLLAFYGDKQCFSQLYPASYDYSRSWDPLTSPFPHLNDLYEVVPDRIRSRLLGAIAEGFATRALELIEETRPHAYSYDLSGLDKNSDEFCSVRDGLYTFVYMSAQAIQAQRLAAAAQSSNGSDRYSEFVSKHQRVFSVLGYISNVGVQGLSGKLSDQAHSAYGCL